ncbi:inositol polyphosphate-5-phosphatase A-like isoform X2 [Lineus longissimus]
MASKYTNVLLVTANVGSIFEDPDRMLKMWLNEFMGCISRLQPDFIAVHCQEVGGKNYEESMQFVNDFIKSLLASDELECYDKGRVFLDEDFTAADKFTALGSIYFVHESVKDVQIWNFEKHGFVPVDGKEVLSGNIESVPIKEKAKFPKEFFPECRWSRKGFIRTRWMLNNSVFDLVNIHLFHDASNFVSMESSPSSYVNYRQRALEHTLNRLENDSLENVPMFMFGDFNFRLDMYHLTKRLTDKTTVHSTKNKKNELSQLIYKDTTNSEKMVLTVEKKAFDHHDQHHELFAKERWLQDYDLELRAFHDRLHEFEVTFPPSYPYSEDVDDGTSYMKTRCPAWCDRIVLNRSAQDCITTSMPIDYSMIGPTVCMGDHKPIYLHFHMRHGTGMLPMKTSPILRRRIISINGEELQDSKMDNFNIHENAKFEKEQQLHPDIRRSLKGRVREAQNGRPGLKSKASFSDVARDVMRAENVIGAFKWHHKRRLHDSSSESSDDDDDDDDDASSSGPKTDTEEVPVDEDSVQVQVIESQPENDLSKFESKDAHPGREVAADAALDHPIVISNPGSSNNTKSDSEVAPDERLSSADDTVLSADNQCLLNQAPDSTTSDQNFTEKELQDAENCNVTKAAGAESESTKPGVVKRNPVLNVAKKSGMCPSCELL